MTAQLKQDDPETENRDPSERVASLKEKEEALAVSRQAEQDLRDKIDNLTTSNETAMENYQHDQQESTKKAERLEEEVLSNHMLIAGSIRWWTGNLKQPQQYLGSIWEMRDLRYRRIMRWSRGQIFES